MKIVIMYCKKKAPLNQSIEFKKIIIKILSTVTIIAITCGISNIVYAAGADEAINKANKIGKTFWKLLVIVGYWIIAFYGGKDILREITQGDTKDVIKVCTKYAIGFAALVMFLQILDLIKVLSE